MYLHIFVFWFRLKVADLFEDVVRVCDIEKGTVEVTMSFTGVLKTFSW